MPVDNPIPALSREAQLKRRLRSHLSNLGFEKSDVGLVKPLGNNKDIARSLHRHQREDLLASNSTFISEKFDNLISNFACGSEVDPAKIAFRLQKIDAGTTESDLFRLAAMTWSVPVSNGFGRRLRYLVWDQQNGKLAGLFALGDPVFNLGARDRVISWSANQRGQQLVNLLDAYVLGALPPYNMLLGGKAVACLVRSREVYSDFATKYGSAKGLISKTKKNARLLAVTTTSSLGRSSVYNRLKLNGISYFEPIGYTQGWGHFHIPDDLFAQLRDHLRTIGHPYADRNRFGHGPNWKLRTIRTAIELLGLDDKLLKHGLQRQVFLSKFADNALGILKSGSGIPDLSNLENVQSISAAARDRWMAPRADRDKSYQSFSTSAIKALLHPIHNKDNKFTANSG